MYASDTPASGMRFEQALDFISCGTNERAVFAGDRVEFPVKLG